MTPDELEAIRDRVALYADPEWRGDQPRWVHAACEDATALLAEVDALNEVVIALQQAVEREGAEVDRLTASNAPNVADIFRAVDAERARLRAAIEAQASDYHRTHHIEPHGWRTCRKAGCDVYAAVLRAIDGEEER